MKKVILICSAFCMVNGQNLYSQGNNWTINRNFNTISTSNFLGTTNNQAIRIKTNNVSRALFTTGNALSTITGDSGDGLRIVNPVNGTAGELDLFTSANSGQNETHIVWGASGQISGQNSKWFSFQYYHIIRYLSIFKIRC
ncbi:MAG: hypothetical protein HYU67_13770 [Flavobacteriia bacterium]|nr:hypothetical protein [Flavobacteriia bacterium]